MKSFVKTSECRRLALLKHFDSTLQRPEKDHLCCDNCAAYAKYPPHQCEVTLLNPVRETEINPQRLVMVEQNLTKYHKSLVRLMVTLKP